MTAGTIIYLDDELLERVGRFTSPQDLSKLVGELLEERVSQFEHAENESAMREGYLATGLDRQELNVEWQVVDGEGWPE